MSALPSSRRAPVPAYYLGRPAEFWLTRLPSRRPGPTAEPPATPGTASPPAAAVDVATQIRLDLSTLRRQLAEARLRQRRKDSPAARHAVTDRLERIDALLDMQLETQHPRRRPAEQPA
jgi:hypothetical protein